MLSNTRFAVGALSVLLLAATLPALANGAPIVGRNNLREDAIGGNKLTASQNALIDKAIVREREISRIVKQRAPLIETYIQSMKPDPDLGQVPVSDEHFLRRVKLRKVSGDSFYEVATEPASQETTNHSKFHFTKPSISLPGRHGSAHLNFHEGGFVQMLLIDSAGFSRQHYSFSYVRSDFLGNTPTAVFDVTPIGGQRATGRFTGRIWIETRNDNVVRFDGNFIGGEKFHSQYYQFDSWRTNVQPNLWLPTSLYVEGSDYKDIPEPLKFKAINHIWGYALKVPAKEALSPAPARASAVSNDSQDVSPLDAQRAWAQQTEDNVVDRLFKAGLIDAPSEFDKTLEAMAGNILIYNNITLPRPIRCRTLLTLPLESIAIGNTIILSKGLLDTTGVVTQDGAQQMGNLNAVLAFQIAHIILAHRLDTAGAFNDRLLFPPTGIFSRIPMHHSDADNAAAAKKAIELLSAKELEGGQQYFGLYLQQLGQRAGALKALNQPIIGDGLMKSGTDSAFWMQDMIAKAPKLDMNDLKQQAAKPLGSYLRADPWSDQVIVMHSSFEPLLSADDKMPFEVEPVYLKLSYYRTSEK